MKGEPMLDEIEEALMTCLGLVDGLLEEDETDQELLDMRQMIQRALEARKLEKAFRP